jgi:hypothetical protein
MLIRPGGQPSEPGEFDYGFPKPAPVPIEGCTTCADYVARRVAARTAGDRTSVTDANILMRRHLKSEHG